MKKGARSGDAPWLFALCFDTTPKGQLCGQEEQFHEAADDADRPPP